MPLTPPRANSGAPALAGHVPGPAASRRGRRNLIIVIAMALALPLLASRALAQNDEPYTNYVPHDLRNVIVCIDTNSVAVHLDTVTRARNPQTSQLGPGISQAIAASLQSLGPSAVARRASCNGSGSYLAVDVRILALDPAVYRHYPSNSYNVGVWVQIGNYTPTRNTSNPALEKVHYDGFDERILTNPRNGAMTQQILANSRTMLADLVTAYQVDNPRSGTSQTDKLANAASGARTVYASLQAGNYDTASSTWQPVDKVIQTLLPTIEFIAPSLADDLEYNLSLVELGFRKQDWSQAAAGAAQLPSLLTKAQTAWTATR